MSGTGSEGILEVLHSPISQEVPMFRLLGAIRQNPFSLCRTARRFAERILLSASALVQSSLQLRQRPSAALVHRSGLFAPQTCPAENTVTPFDEPARRHRPR